MTKRSTRNKLRFQSLAAMEDLRHAQTHLTHLGQLANDMSPYINEHLPVIMVALEMVQKTLRQFDERL